MTSTGTERHLTDAEMVRYVDDAASAEETARWRRHVAGCTTCAEGVRALEEESRILHHWLEAAAFEADLLPADSGAPRSLAGAPALAAEGPRIPRAVPRWRPTGASWLRAAAILILLAAPLAAFPSVRAWVAERVVGPPAGGAGEEVTTAAAAEEESTVVRFVPDPGEFVVRFDAESRGALTVERSADGEAVLIAAGGDPRATVSPAALRIQNSDAGRYLLRLPAATTAARVSIGDRTVAVSGDEIDRGTTIELR